MKTEALNCPNCGAGAASDKRQCEFCRTRLKTVGCPSCLGAMFAGTKFCGHCGEKVIAAKLGEEKNGDCPRCNVKLEIFEIGSIKLRECGKCDGLWISVETFEEVCANHEKQAEVLRAVRAHHIHPTPAKISYVPCPDCKNLMNRNNFARISGVIVDICRQHGVWCDAEELPRIIEFIRQGGLDHAREKEKIRLDEQRKAIIDLQRQTARHDARFELNNAGFDSPSTTAIRHFVRFLFD